VKVGDIVKIRIRPPSMPHFGESRYLGMCGMIIKDLSPHRHYSHAGRVMDVMWESGEIEDMYTQDLEVVNESR